jgi:hypothetical protein
MEKRVSRQFREEEFGSHLDIFHNKVIDDHGVPLGTEAHSFIG